MKYKIDILFIYKLYLLSPNQPIVRLLKLTNCLASYIPELAIIILLEIIFRSHQCEYVRINMNTYKKLLYIIGHALKVDWNEQQIHWLTAVINWLECLYRDSKMWVGGSLKSGDGQKHLLLIYGDMRLWK